MSTTATHAFSHLEELTRHSQANSISIIMPTHTSGSQVQQNAIRFKNLVTQAAERLVARGQSPVEIEKRLQPLRELQRNDDFWQHRTSGLALYFSEGQPTTIDLYQRAEEFVFVGERYFLPTSVLEAVSRQPHWALALTWKEARLYEANQTSLLPVDNEYFPVSLRDVVLPPDAEEQLQFRTQSTGSGGTMFHGQGAGEEMLESDRHRFLSEIGKRLLGVTHEQSLPLVVIGTEELQGEFAKATKVVANYAITLSPDSLSDAEFQERILGQINDEHNAKNNGDALIDQLEVALTQNRASRNIDQILEAAGCGRIDCLLIEQRVGFASDRLTESQLTQINAALIEALQTGSRVVKCTDGSLVSSPMAAIYRY